MKDLLIFSLSKIVLVVGSLILVAYLASPYAVTGQVISDVDDDLEDKFSAGDALYNDYIPFITRGYCKVTSASQFTVQIAGLSDFIIHDGQTLEEVHRMRELEIGSYNDAFPALVNSVRDSGADWARVYIDWSYIQPLDPEGGVPTYDWSNYDNWLSQVVSESVQIIATVSNPPIWAAVDKSDSETCTNMIRPDKVTDFYNFLGELVNRYKLAPYNVHVWELLNEPDAIDGYRCSTGVSNYGEHGTEYAALLPEAYQVIKTADPFAKVIMGGIANDLFYLPYDDEEYYDGSLAGKFNRYFTDDIMENGADENLDAVNFHYFKDFSAEWERWTVGGDGPPTCGYIRTQDGITYSPYGLDLVAKGSHFLNRLSTCFNVNKPLWITEVGMHGIDPNSEYFNDELLARYNAGQTLENQAMYVFKVYARGLSLGAENITWYAIKINPIITPGDFQGLLYDSRDVGKENQPKPAFFAYQTLTQELDGYKFDESLDGPLNGEAYSFTHPCYGTKIMAWTNEVDATVPYTISEVTSVQMVYRPLAEGVENVVIIDGDANDLDMTVNGSITVPLVLEPVIILLIP